MPRDTRTGHVLESMVLPALAKGKYTFPAKTGRTLIGLRPGGRRHFADVMAEDAQGRRFLVSVKWQQTSGTAEQKVPFEVISLIHLLKSEPAKYARAYVVLGGSGWTLREFYVNGGLEEYIPDSGMVRILKLEDFIALANKGKL